MDAVGDGGCVGYASGLADCMSGEVGEGVLLLYSVKAPKHIEFLSVRRPKRRRYMQVQNVK